MMPPSPKSLERGCPIPEIFVTVLYEEMGHLLSTIEGRDAFAPFFFEGMDADEKR